MTLRLEVLDDDEVVDETTSADGVAAQVTLGEPDCLFSRRPHAHRAGLPDRHRSHGRHVPLERSGSF